MLICTCENIYLKTHLCINAIGCGLQDGAQSASTRHNHKQLIGVSRDEHITRTVPNLYARCCAVYECGH